MVWTITDTLAILLMQKRNERCFGESQTVCYLAVEWTKETLDAYNPSLQRMNLAIIAKTYPIMTNPLEGELSVTNTSHGEPEVNEELRLITAETMDSDSSVEQASADDSGLETSHHSPNHRVKRMRKGLLTFLHSCCIHIPHSD
ncbi:hypothetical protein ECG_07565 [Echinococcus granulosus]|nr:hypothetical protein ECG_07565 [Echinococcus granulosus]